MELREEHPNLVNRKKGIRIEVYLPYHYPKDRSHQYDKNKGNRIASVITYQPLNRFLRVIRCKRHYYYDILDYNKYTDKHTILITQKTISWFNRIIYIKTYEKTN